MVIISKAWYDKFTYGYKNIILQFSELLLSWNCVEKILLIRYIENDILHNWFLEYAPVVAILREILRSILYLLHANSSPFPEVNATKFQFISYGCYHDYDFGKYIFYHDKRKSYHLKWDNNDKDKKIRILKINVPKYIWRIKIIISSSHGQFL